jgi:hypothetical protein
MNRISVRRVATVSLVIVVIASLTALLVVSIVRQPATTNSESNHPVNVSLVDNVLSNTPSDCGAWATSSTDPTASDFANNYGTVATCQLIGYTWVLITRGISNPPPDVVNDPSPPNASWIRGGVVATYNCNSADAICLNGSSAHPYSNWKISNYPTNGYLVLIGFPGPTELLFQIDGSQQYFNTQTAAFTANPPSTVLSECWSSWDSLLASQSVGTDNATPSMEQAFERSNPQCMTP